MASALWRAFVCLSASPARGRPIGTLTVYMGFQYDFSDLDRSVLKTLAGSFALFWARLHGQQLQLKAEEQLYELQAIVDDKRLAEARGTAILPIVSLLHQSKN